MDKVMHRHGYLPYLSLNGAEKQCRFLSRRKQWYWRWWQDRSVRHVAHFIRSRGGTLPFDVALTPLLAPEPVWMYFSEQAGTPLFHEIWARNEYIKDRKVKALASRKKVDLFLKFYGYRRQ